MDQRKEAVFRYIDEHRQEILEDWKALVNHEGSLRQPDAMHAEAEYLCGRFREAGVDCAVYSESPEIPPVVMYEFLSSVAFSLVISFLFQATFRLVVHVKLSVTTGLAVMVPSIPMLRSVPMFWSIMLEVAPPGATVT